jgi:hypothetical protein
MPHPPAVRSRQRPRNSTGPPNEGLHQTKGHTPRSRPFAAEARRCRVGRLRGPGQDEGVKKAKPALATGAAGFAAYAQCAADSEELAPRAA